MDDFKVFLIIMFTVLGFLIGDVFGVCITEAEINDAICKQLYKETDTYLEQVIKPWRENVTKISECEVKNVENS